MEQSIVRKKLLEYLEETRMSKYKFAQRSGISLSTIYDIIRKEDYDIRESNIIKICHGMQIEPFDLFQTSEEILVLEKDEEIQAILEARSLPEEYREIMLEYLHSLKRIAEKYIMYEVAYKQLFCCLFFLRNLHKIFR